MYKFIVGVVVCCSLIGAWFFYTEIYTDVAQEIDQVDFQIKKNESVSVIADRLAEEQVIRNAWIFKKYVSFKGIDKDINFGSFTVSAPITLSRVAAVLSEPGVNEKTITILPGWDLRDIAAYLEEQNIGTEKEFFSVAGRPATQSTSHKKLKADVLQDLKLTLSLEGYLAPETYRIYSDATVEDVVDRLVEHRDSQFTKKMYQDIKKQDRTVHEVMTIASLVEREVRGKKDRPKVADIFWRRYDANWGLQADSTVHYVFGKKGDVFTTAEDRSSKNPWNTYKHAGLPPGPISNPSIESIMAAIYPEKNSNWYFITTLEGEAKFAKTLEDHNKNVNKYLRN